MRLIGIVSPVILFPYLLNIFGVDNYATLALSFTLLGLSSSFISYGFDITGPKSLSQDSLNANKVLSTILFSKFVLFILVILTSVSGFYVASLLSFNVNYYPIIILLFSSIIEVVNPIWYSIYYDKVKIFSLLTVAYKSLILIFSFTFIKNADDFIIFCYIHSALSLFYSLAILLVNVRLFKIGFNHIYFRRSLIDIKGNFMFFVSRSATVVKDRMGIVILSIFSTPAVVVKYDIIRKFIDTGLVPFTIVNSVFYPRIIKNQEIQTPLYLSVVSFFVGLICSIILFALFYSYSGKYLNISYEIDELSILLLMPLISASLFLGNTALAAFGHYKIFNFGSVASLICFAVLIFIYTYIEGDINFVVFSLILISNVLFDILYRLFFIFKLNFKK